MKQRDGAAFHGDAPRLQAATPQLCAVLAKCLAWVLITLSGQSLPASKQVLKSGCASRCAQRRIWIALKRIEGWQALCSHGS